MFQRKHFLDKREFPDLSLTAFECKLKYKPKENNLKEATRHIDPIPFGKQTAKLGFLQSKHELLILSNISIFYKLLACVNSVIFLS